jgi:F-type H+-transporting ATPase subunit a
MAEHFTYLTPLTSNVDAQKFITAIALGGGLVFLGTSLTRRLRNSEELRERVVPSSSISLFGIVDFFVESFLAFQDSILGKEGRRHAPFTATIFLFLFLANLIGLIPGVPALTTSVWVNVGMALAVFLYFNAQGIREQGLVPYLKHFAGPVIWLAWLIFPLEIFGVLLRILTLNLRLYWNVTADHMVLEILTGILGLGAIPVYVIGTFVSFMQAFVFTTLTMVYILLATQHEEGHEEGHH